MKAHRAVIREQKGIFFLPMSGGSCVSVAISLSISEVRGLDLGSDSMVVTTIDLDLSPADRK